MRSFTLRLAGFAGAPILSALAPFIVLPAISRLVGADGWANVSTGQSVGLLGMVGVLFGWGVLGPVLVARSESDESRARTLVESLRTRALTAILFVPLAGIVTFLISGPAYRAESVFIAVAMALGGLSPAWFCIGEGKPRALMVFDAIPKLIASAIALPVILLTGQIIWYPLLLILFTLPAFAAHAVLVIRAGHGGPPPRTTRAVLRGLLPTAAIDATGNAYGATSVPIATAGLSPVDASAFASADRVYRIGLLAVVALGNGLQAWVIEPSATDRPKRHRIAISLHVGVGLVGGLLIATLGPWATALVFGAAVAAQPLPAVLFGVAFLCISTATPLIRNILIPAGRYRVVLTATVAAAIAGVATMLGGSFLGSAALIATGVAVSEAVALAVVALPALRLLRGDRDQASDTSGTRQEI